MVMWDECISIEIDILFAPLWYFNDVIIKVTNNSKIMFKSNGDFGTWIERSAKRVESFVL